MRSPFKGRKFEKWLFNRLVALEVEAMRRKGIDIKPLLRDYKPEKARKQ